MIIHWNRKKDNGKSTTGIFQCEDLKGVTMEDTGRDLNHDGDLNDPGEKKVWGETRIPARVYEVKLRKYVKDKSGTLNEKYKKHFDFHKGMLHLQNVEHFEYIYIHILNKAEESHGCLGPGTKKVNDDYISGSTIAYTRLYAYCIDAFERGEGVFISIKDEDY